MTSATTQHPGGFLHPEKIIKDIGIFSPGMTVADFGAGAGYFTLPLARSVGPVGKVRAIDVRASALNLLESHARHVGLFNIVPLHGDLEQPRGSTLPDMSMKAVLLSNVLYQAESKDAIIQEAFRVLIPSGQLVILEWDPAAYLGPPKAVRLSSKTVQALVEKQGLKLQKEFSGGQAHYGLLFRKPEASQP